MIAGAGLPAATALASTSPACSNSLPACSSSSASRPKIAAYLLALFCVFTALVFHSGPINVRISRKAQMAC